MMGKKRTRKIPEDMVVGYIHESKNCGIFEVVNYLKSSEVTIRFPETGYTYTTNASNIRTGKVADKTYYKVPLDMQVGYIHNTNKDGKVEIIEYAHKTKIGVRFLNSGEEVYTTALILRKGTLLGEKYTPVDMRAGVIHKTNNHGDLEIIRYMNAEDVAIRFLQTGVVRSHISSNSIRCGRVWDITRCKATNNKDILLYGVGFNDADYTVRKNNKEGLEIWCCPYYAKWKDMLRRCYCTYSLSKRPSYLGCTVCEEWLTFSNFRLWMETKDYQGKHLDKDLRVKGNKVYSPSTCIFISGRINTILNSKYDEDVGSYISASGKKHYSACSNPFNIGVGKHLGVYDTKEDANSAHKNKKIEYVKTLAEEENDPVVTRLLFKYFNIEGEDYE